MRNLWQVALCFVLLLGYATPVGANVPITTDSRIKTYVYNENEVFPITVHYGYMTSIEFPANEKITTIAPGNGYSWKFIQDGSRLFIKALEGSAHTNMTIITSKHTYQFELESKDPSNSLDEQLVYVVRFYYPDQLLDAPQAQVNTNYFAPQPISQVTPAPVAPTMPSVPDPDETIAQMQPPSSPSFSAAPTPSMPQEPMAKPGQSINFDYTLSGPDTIAPIKVFDDGKETFMLFPDNNALIPHFFTTAANGQETRVSFSRKGEYIAIALVAPQFILRLGEEEVKVFNEAAH